MLKIQNTLRYSREIFNIGVTCQKSVDMLLRKNYLTTALGRLSTHKILYEVSSCSNRRFSVVPTSLNSRYFRSNDNIISSVINLPVSQKAVHGTRGKSSGSLRPNEELVKVTQDLIVHIQNSRQLRQKQRSSSLDGSATNNTSSPGTDKTHDCQESKSKSLRHCFDTLTNWLHAAKTGRAGFEAGLQAQSLLAELHDNLVAVLAPEDEKNRGHSEFFVPDARSYDIVMETFAVCNGGRLAAEEAQIWLERMLALCYEYCNSCDLLLATNTKGEGKRSRKLKVSPVEPTVFGFNSVIRAWAKSNDREAGVKAEHLLNEMYKWRQFCQDRQEQDDMFPFNGCLPDERTLVGMIEALSRSNFVHGHDRAYELVMKVVNAKVKTSTPQFCESIYAHIRLDAAVFNNLMQAYIRTGRRRQIAAKVEEIFHIMIKLKDEAGINDDIKPDAMTWFHVIDAWARVEMNEKRGDAAQRSESILIQMLALYRAGENVKPTTMCFTSCITAWSLCRNSADAAERADCLYQMLLQLYKDTGDVEFKPGSLAGIAVITAWSYASHRSDATDRSLAILNQLEWLGEANLMTYNAVLYGMAKRGLSEQACRLFGLLSDGKRGCALQPDTSSYNSVLTALSNDKTRPDAAVCADRLLQEMKEDAKWNVLVKPSKVSFTCVMNAWARSSSYIRRQRCMELLSEMLTAYKAGDAGMKPDDIALSTYLVVNARLSGSDYEWIEAFELAFECYECYASNGQSDNAKCKAYYVMMSAISRHVKNDRDRAWLLEQVFQHCYEQGYVTKQILSIAISTGTFDKRQRSTVLQPLSPYWSRNVEHKDLPKLFQLK